MLTSCMPWYSRGGGEGNWTYPARPEGWGWGWWLKDISPSEWVAGRDLLG